MLIDLGQGFLLDEKRKKAKAKIEQLLAPLWNEEEIPKILDLDRFKQSAEAVWKNTGSNFLGELLTQDTIDRPLFEISREIDSLKTISDFVVEKSGAVWTHCNFSLELPLVGWTAASFPLFTVESIKAATQPYAGAALAENLDCSAIQKIDGYVSDLTAALAANGNVYYLAVPGYDSWQQIESHARRYATSYISRLLYLHRSLERLLAARDSSKTNSSSIFLFYSAKESNKVTPQVSKRPPTPSTLI